MEGIRGMINQFVSDLTSNKFILYYIGIVLTIFSISLILKLKSSIKTIYKAATTLFIILGLILIVVILKSKI